MSIGIEYDPTDGGRFESRIQALSRAVWEERVNQRTIDLWLNNFKGVTGDVAVERTHALHLLSNFMYFGQREIRELLKVLYRDHICYPLIQEIKSSINDNSDPQKALTQFELRMREYRFLGVGNPSDSGSYLLYYFRQENKLSRKLFLNTHEILNNDFDPTVKHLVFIDDFCGSGKTAKRYSRDLLSKIKEHRPEIETTYCVLFGFTDALESVREDSEFNFVAAAIELDDQFRCFSNKSRIFTGTDETISREFSEKMTRSYGSAIYAKYPLGFEDGQLLLGFSHNTPNNSLPIMWGDEQAGWNPVFPRYRKQFGWSDATRS